MTEIVLEFKGKSYKTIPPILRDDQGSGMCRGCAFYGVPEGATSDEAWDFCIDLAVDYCTVGSGSIFVEKES